jgi:hypothetical protein
MPRERRSQIGSTFLRSPPSRIEPNFLIAARVDLVHTDHMVSVDYAGDEDVRKTTARKQPV